MKKMTIQERLEVVERRLDLWYVPGSNFTQDCAELLHEIIRDYKEQQSELIERIRKLKTLVMRNG